MKSRRRPSAGFTLIELLIVVAIILIIAAIAIPNLMRSRMAANETSAIGSIRTINAVEIQYMSSNPRCGFANLETLGDLHNNQPGGGLLDSQLASGIKSGYSFTVNISGGTGEPPECSKPYSNYTVSADPTSPQQGQRHYYSDPSGVIRYNDSGPADANSSVLQ